MDGITNGIASSNSASSTVVTEGSVVVRVSRSFGVETLVNMSLESSLAWVGVGQRGMVVFDFLLDRSVFVSRDVRAKGHRDGADEELLIIERAGLKVDSITDVVGIFASSRGTEGIVVAEGSVGGGVGRSFGVVTSVHMSPDSCLLRITVGKRGVMFMDLLCDRGMFFGRDVGAKGHRDGADEELLIIERAGLKVDSITDVVGLFASSNGTGGSVVAEGSVRVGVGRPYGVVALVNMSSDTCLLGVTVEQRGLMVMDCLGDGFVFFGRDLGAKGHRDGTGKHLLT
jgi:hypothetical protein